jgi:hypothetical protein
MNPRRLFLATSAATLAGGTFLVPTVAGGQRTRPPAQDPILKELELQARVAAKAMAKPTADAAARFSFLLTSLAAYIEANDLDRVARHILREEIHAKGRDALLDEWLSFDVRADAKARGFEVAPMPVTHVSRADLDRAVTMGLEMGVSPGLRLAASEIDRHPIPLSRIVQVQLTQQEICSNQQLLAAIMHLEWGVLCAILPEACLFGVLMVSLWELYMWWSSC